MMKVSHFQKDLIKAIEKYLFLNIFATHYKEFTNLNKSKDLYLLFRQHYKL